MNAWQCGCDPSAKWLCRDYPTCRFGQWVAAALSDNNEDGEDGEDGTDMRELFPLLNRLEQEIVAMGDRLKDRSNGHNPARVNFTVAQEFEDFWKMFSANYPKAALARSAVEAVYYAGACSGVMLAMEAPDSDARLRLVQEFDSWAKLRVEERAHRELRAQEFVAAHPIPFWFLNCMQTQPKHAFSVVHANDAIYFRCTTCDRMARMAHVEK